MGPNVTTGLRKPAAGNQNTVNLRIQTGSVISAVLSEPLTLSQNHSFIRWELGLDRLGGEVLSALPQVPLRTPKPAKAPEVGPVAPGCFGERILHARELLRSDNKWQKVREASWCQAGLMEVA